MTNYKFILQNKEGLLFKKHNKPSAGQSRRGTSHVLSCERPHWGGL